MKIYRPFLLVSESRTYRSVGDSNMTELEYRRMLSSGKAFPSHFQFPKHVEGEKDKPLHDFILGYNQAPYISERCRNILQTLLGEACSYIQVGCLDSINYYVMNLTCILDCLDFKNAKIIESSKGKVIKISQYAFLEDKIPNDVYAFRVEVYPSDILVTEKFVEVVIENKFTGVGFENPCTPQIVSYKSEIPGLPIILV